MIVCDLGDRWQIVMQTDHADLSGDFARRWKQRGDRADSLAIAAERHDDGRAVWEQAPSCDLETGKPVNFLDVRVLSHLAFDPVPGSPPPSRIPTPACSSRCTGPASIAAGTACSRKLGLTQAEQAREQVEAFVAEQESGFEARDAEAGVTAEQRRWDYELLQITTGCLFCFA